MHDIKFCTWKLYGRNLLAKELKRLEKSFQGNTDKCAQRMAMCVLHLVLKKCDAEVLEENVQTWMRYLLKVINTNPCQDMLNMSFKLLALVSSVQYV